MLTISEPGCLTLFSSFRISHKCVRLKAFLLDDVEVLIELTVDDLVAQSIIDGLPKQTTFLIPPVPGTNFPMVRVWWVPRRSTSERLRAPSTMAMAAAMSTPVRSRHRLPVPMGRALVRVWVRPVRSAKRRRSTAPV